jgi:pyrrolidone-carboxylate peptidase
LLNTPAMDVTKASNRNLTSAAALLVAVFVVLSSAWSQAQTATAQKTVFLTSFLPFKDRDLNNSMLVTDRLKPMLEARGYRVEVCHVPVIWDRSALMAIDCYRQMAAKADLAVSFGEGGSEHIATGARNRNNNTKDETGDDNPSDKIDASLPKYMEFQLSHGLSLKDLASQARVKIEIKKNPGTFVCNNLAFRLRNYFVAEQVPFFFMHVRAIQPDTKKVLKPAELDALARNRVNAANETAAKAFALIDTLLANP